MWRSSLALSTRPILHLSAQYIYKRDNNLPLLLIGWLLEGYDGESCRLSYGWCLLCAGWFLLHNCIAHNWTSVIEESLRMYGLSFFVPSEASWRRGMLLPRKIVHSLYYAYRMTSRYFGQIITEVFVHHSLSQHCRHLQQFYPSAQLK